MIFVVLSAAVSLSNTWHCSYGQTCQAPDRTEGSKGTYVTYTIIGDDNSLPICKVMGLGFNGSGSQCKWDLYFVNESQDTYTVLWDDVNDFPAVHCTTKNFGDGVKWSVESGVGEFSCKGTESLKFLTV